MSRSAEGGEVSEARRSKSQRRETPADEDTHPAGRYFKYATFLTIPTPSLLLADVAPLRTQLSELFQHQLDMNSKHPPYEECPRPCGRIKILPSQEEVTMNLRRVRLT
jgi:hypothetical protein